ncbi:hypothetical protein PACTADRAFT_51431 [Pachysolen tannophilus NRRL Y-2460]|uniref:Uncharacterized protein n=1 Tax=Pachysolen tannophilus NRRL Y-2460 TaxID=669874 RepID=A0A1E4TPR0_PACTA|nr:hypothetical protein PACTADRAFT_51431 [Pachysolen tannophilus NRRL Y-2460]
MISATSWVPRGYASEFPEKYELDDEEMARITAMANLEISDARKGLKEAEEAEEVEGTTEESSNRDALKDEIEFDNDLKEYDLENYDNGPVDSEGTPLTMFPGLSNSDARYHENEGEDGNGDPYISLPTEDDLQQEKEELQVYPTDNMVLATRTEDDVSYLDVYIYDDGAGAPEGSNEEEGDKLDRDAAKGLVRESNLYVHHDLMLPAFPLCVEWINFKPNGENNDSNIGNFAAIGTFDPTIEIWNLDSIDKAFPDVILGENNNNNNFQLKKNSKKNKKIKIFISVLASTSADSTVKIWDLSTASAVRSMNQIHQGKQVSSSQWYKDDGSILLTGGYDGHVAISDVRISSDENMTKRWRVGNGTEDVESVKWGSLDGLFYAGTDKGNVYCFDAKMTSKPVWTLHAHDAGISSLEINNFIPGLLVTCAMGEKLIKLWKVNQQNIPSMVLSRDFGCGNVFSSCFAPDIEVCGNLTIGGVTGGLKMWDCFSNRGVRAAFKDELKILQKKARDFAKENGRSSRIARKYINDQTTETIMVPETGGLEEDEEDLDAEEAWENED